MWLSSSCGASRCGFGATRVLDDPKRDEGSWEVPGYMSCRMSCRMSGQTHVMSRCWACVGWVSVFGASRPMFVRETPGHGERSSRTGDRPGGPSRAGEDHEKASKTTVKQHSFLEP